MTVAERRLARRATRRKVAGIRQRKMTKALRLVTELAGLSVSLVRLRAMNLRDRAAEIVEGEARRHPDERIRRCTGRTTNGKRCDCPSRHLGPHLGGYQSSRTKRAA